MKSILLVIDDYITTIQSTKNLSNQTILAYKSDLIDFSSYLIQNKFDEQIVLKYVNYLSQIKLLKDSTIKRKLIVLKMFFEYLTRHKYIETNYYAMHSFKFRQEKRLPKILTPKEVQNLLTCARAQIDKATQPFDIWKTTRNLALIDILISTGIRIAEASNISLNDIIYSERVILIHGKGRKQRLIYISCHQTWNNLIKWIKTRKTLTTYTDMLFVNRYGKQLGIHGIEYIYKQLKTDTQINPKSTPHYLRHTFATYLLANGADLRSVQEILGHSSVAITEIYTEVTANRKKQVLNKYNYRNKL